MPTYRDGDGLPQHMAARLRRMRRGRQQGASARRRRDAAAEGAQGSRAAQRHDDGEQQREVSCSPKLTRSGGDGGRDLLTGVLQECLAGRRCQPPGAAARGSRPLAWPRALIGN